MGWHELLSVTCKWLEQALDSVPDAVGNVSQHRICLRHILAILLEQGHLCNEAAGVGLRRHCDPALQVVVPLSACAARKTPQGEQPRS